MHRGSDAGIVSKAFPLPESEQRIIVFTNGENGFKIYSLRVVAFSMISYRKLHQYN